MSQACILIVDDEPINLVLLESLLEDFYPVRAVGSAQEALALAEDPGAGVAMVLSDVQMPGMDGLALCRHLRAQTHTADLPVLLISGFASEADELAGLQAGASDLVTKPYCPDLLLARVRTHWRLRELERQAQPA